MALQHCWQDPIGLETINETRVVKKVVPTWTNINGLHPVQLRRHGRHEGCGGFHLDGHKGVGAFGGIPHHNQHLSESMWKMIFGLSYS
jgi:hypothetical protein